MTKCIIFYSILIIFINYPQKTASSFFPSLGGGCSCPQPSPCQSSTNCQLPAQSSYCSDYCQSNFVSNCPIAPECPPPISNCPPVQACRPPPKAEYCGNYCPKVQTYGNTNGNSQIVYPAGSVGALTQGGGQENGGYVAGISPGPVGGGGAPGLYSVPAASASASGPPSPNYSPNAEMSVRINMHKSTGSGGTYSDKSITDDNLFSEIEQKVVVTNEETPTTTTTVSTTTIDTYDDIVTTNEDFHLELEELHNETNTFPTFKYTLPPSVTDEVGLTETKEREVVTTETENSSDLNLLPVDSIENVENQGNATNATLKVFNPDPLTLDYSDNDLSPEFNYKLKSRRLAGVKNVVVNVKPKCSHEILQKLMRENMVASPTISKQMIFSAGRQMFKRPIDVVCSKNKFSYTVLSSKLFCEVTKRPVTCFAFVQPDN